MSYVQILKYPDIFFVFFLMSLVLTAAPFWISFFLSWLVLRRSPYWLQVSSTLSAAVAFCVVFALKREGGWSPSRSDVGLPFFAASMAWGILTVTTGWVLRRRRQEVPTSAVPAETGKGALR